MNRISDKVLDELDTLDDLWYKMTDGGKINYSGIGSCEEFKNRFYFYRQYLQKELPELTEEEVLRFDEIFHKFKKAVYSFYGFDHYLAALEFIKNKENETKST